MDTIKSTEVEYRVVVTSKSGKSVNSKWMDYEAAKGNYDEFEKVGYGVKMEKRLIVYYD